MLKLEPESFCIAVEESDVAEVYRSTTSVRLSPEEKSAPPFLAFVCVLKEERGCRVFAALHARELKRSLVYVVAPETAGQASSETLIEKALAFTEAMGFAMEPVSLQYSPAMREVVLKGIPVLVSPENAETMRLERAAQLAEWEKTMADHEADGQAEQGAVDLSADEHKARQERAEAAARKLAAERRNDEQAKAVRQSVEKILFQVNGPEALGAERRRLTAEIQSAEKRAADLESTVLRMERRAEQVRAEAQKRATDLEKALAVAKEQAETEGSEREKIARAAAFAEKRLVELEKELIKAWQELEAGESARNALVGQKEAAERRVGELEEMVRGARSRAEAEEMERKRIETALVQQEQQLAGLKAEKLRMLESAEAGASAHDKMTETQIAALNEALRVARGEVEAGRLEKEQLALNKRASEESLRQQIAELEKESRQAGERAESLHLELEQMTAAKTAAERQVQALITVPATAGAMAQEAPMEASPPAAGLKAPAKEEAAPPPHVVRRPPPRGAFFRVDWDKTRIECASSADVLEAYQPMGLLQLNLEGYPSQHCSAYIVALKSGARRQVHVAFRLSESERTLIYEPSRPILNKTAYAEAVKEAVKFLEVVGYIPEKIALGGSAQSRAKALSGIPFLNVGSG